MTDIPPPPMPRDLAVLVAAALADPMVRDPYLWLADALALQRRAEVLAADFARARPFRATVVKVERVKASERTPSGKCLITLDTEDRQGNAETIETDWVDTNPLARQVARTAQAAKGELVELWKVNDPDATGNVSQGFRRVLWITRLHREHTPDAPTRGETYRQTEQRVTGGGDR